MSALAAALPADLPVVWEPNSSAQHRFLTCPVRELLGEGNRGGGKTDVLLMDFAQHVGEGWGRSWRGVIFRRRQKDLEDLVAKSRRFFHRIFPRARFLLAKSDYKWVFPDGEELLLRFGEKEDDYWQFHGHEYPWMGFEELTSWPDDSFYLRMHSCCRSSVPDIPRKIRSTTNPWGPGHGWVKERWIDRARPEQVIREQAISYRYDEDTRDSVPVRTTVERVYVHFDLRENVHLMRAQPEYVAELHQIKNEELRKAWLEGDWNVVVGGFLQGVWDPQVHVVKPFPIPINWRRWRSMDWGFRRPYSVGWYTQSPDGVIYRYRELYGYGGSPNVGSRESAREVAEKIREAEASERRLGCMFVRNPADSSIWSNTGTEHTVADLFDAARVHWMKADKSPGSRINGAQVVIDRLNDGGFKVFDVCRHFLRTVPALEHDENEWEDVDTDQEDHVWDELRYSLVSRHEPTEQPKRGAGPAAPSRRPTFEELTAPPAPRPGRHTRAGARDRRRR